LDPVGIDDSDIIRGFISRFGKFEIEIGSGNGHFLVNYGRRHPECGFLGIEAKKKRALKIASKVKNARLENVLVFHGSAESLLDLLLPSSCDAIHVYFPDPWPKTKHRRRRFMKKEILELFDTLLKPHGKIYFASDVFDYYLQVKLLGILSPVFSVSDEMIPEDTGTSLFLQRTVAAGKSTHGIVLKKGK
jgi:tRNA (guanine-N(7)-)-methyltransferase